MFSQKSVTMNTKKSWFKVFSANHLVASYKVAGCRPETVFAKGMLFDKPPKKQYMVRIHSHVFAAALCITNNAPYTAANCVVV